MSNRIPSHYLAALALVLFMFCTTRATAEDPVDKPVTLDGKIVSVTAAKLVMTDKDGKEHSRTLTAEVKFTCDAKPCKVEDLKAGMKIKVTGQKDDRHVVARIEAFANDTSRDRPESKGSPREAPAVPERTTDKANILEGKIVSVTATRLVMTDKDGKEHSRDLTAKVEFSRDDQACKAEDLKPGMRIKVTAQKDDRHVVTRIESFAKDKVEPRDRSDSTRPSRDSEYQSGLDQATITVNLPDGARLKFADYVTVSTGSHRQFLSPPIERGKKFYYTLTADLTRDGKTETVTKQIAVQAGEETRVEMVFGKEAAPVATKPLP